MFGRVSSVIAACFLAVSVYFLLPSAANNKKTDISYVAAVVEFNPKGAATLNPDASSVALDLDKYLAFVLDAKSQNADIIVFPEYGLTTIAPYNQRALALKFSQIVPDPASNTVPCTSENIGPHAGIVHQLSCSASENQIYIVANLLEYFEDNRSKEVLLFNTDVVFDRTGQVVARYRKFNLFGEVALNKTANAEHSIFKTDFGMTFGVVTCFDLMFNSPTVELVKNFNVNGVVFPTAWFSELPFLTAAQAQAAWSFGMKVDLLAAGYNFPQAGSTGSGVYQNGRFNAMMFSDEESKLLVAKVNKKEYHSQLRSYSCGYTTSEENLGNYLSKELTLAEDVKTEIMCFGDFCCQIDYSILPNSGDNSESAHYHMLVFNGYRTHAQTYKGRLQVCGIVACSGSEKQSCAHNFGKSLYSKNVIFSTMNIKANFSSSAAVLPNTLESKYCAPLRSEHYTIGSKIIDNENVEYHMQLYYKTSGIHTFALYGHGFGSESD